MRTLSGQKVCILDLETIDLIRSKVDKLGEEFEHLSHEDVVTKELLIQRMHQYNEIKDLCLDIMGKLAIVKQTTIKDLYPDYDLDLDD